MYAAVNDNRYDNAAGTANLAKLVLPVLPPIIDCPVADSLRLSSTISFRPTSTDAPTWHCQTGGIYNFFFSINEQNGWNRFAGTSRAYHTANFRFRIGFSDNGASANGLAIDHVVLSDPGLFDLGIVRPCFRHRRSGQRHAPA